MRILTGCKPTNKLHLGNYFGIIPTIKKLQQDSDNEILLFSADLHALTTESTIFQQNELIIKFFLSCLDCSNITLYIQSDFPQLTYCMWLFSCVTPMGFLDKMTQYKDKIQKNMNINSGLFNYPLLMAADILMTDANYIPVGQDQIQHLELTRDIVRFYQNKFKASFNIPHPLLSETPKIYDLQKKIKMSKSNEDEKGTLFLNDSNDDIIKKIKKATTDNELMPDNVESIKNTRHFVWNLCQIFSLTSNKSYEYIENEYGNKQISYFKSHLIDSIIDFLSPIRDNLNNLTTNDVKKSLNHEKMHNIFNKKLDELKHYIF